MVLEAFVLSRQPATVVSALCCMRTVRPTLEGM
jgi:hypothetical protein